MAEYYNKKNKIMKPYKAILIDSVNREIKEVEINEYDEIPQMLDCRMITIAHYINRVDCVYIDDEGRLVNPENFFIYGGSKPFAGNGLVVGIDGEEDVINPLASLDEIKDKVMFFSSDQVGGMFY